MHNVLALILGGGRGTRLHPLTKERSKPAVPLAGKYRLIDVPISNCINSGVNRIFVLTQFLAQSLNHHVAQAYRFDSFRRTGFVSILAAEQTEGMGTSDWYQGTADAVRKTLRHTNRYRFDEFLILSGDHIYRMDYEKMIAEHRERDADITVAALEVARDKVSELGVMEIDDHGGIQRFVEKPKDDAIVDTLEIAPRYFELRDEEVRKGLFLANMGVYVFKREALIELLEASDDEDFGKQILPYAIEHGMKMYSHMFNGYWEDIGTIRAFFDANLAFADPVPKFSFYDEVDRMYTRTRHLPPAKLVNNAQLERTLLTEGCILDGASINRAMVGIRSLIGRSTIKSSILMGADYYENDEDRAENSLKNRPAVGIGSGCHIERTIVDKNARIGNNVKLVGNDVEDKQGNFWTLRDGVLVIHKDAVVPDGTELVF
ncbi:glucose-1-phosphate adenylyltransferase [bacterium]|nr:glucose-1-phosphate adenylyltransferase [bacterium]